jgi:hypothetical protein
LKGKRFNVNIALSVAIVERKKNLSTCFFIQVYL